MNSDDVVGWPVERARHYRRSGCWRGKPLGAYLWANAERWGSRPALIAGDQTLSYQALAGRCDDLAMRLSALGLRRNDTVLVQLPNGLDLMIVVMACFRLGVVPVPMRMERSELAMAAVGAHVDAAAVIVAGIWRGIDRQSIARRMVRALPRQASVLVLGDRPAPDTVDLRALLAAGDGAITRHRWLDEHAPSGPDLALFLLTDADRDELRVVGHTHEAYECCVRCSAAAAGFDSTTVYLAVLPASHHMVLGPGILAALHAGGRVVLLASNRADAAFEAITRHGVTAATVTPDLAQQWVAHRPYTRSDLSTLRALHVGGSILAPTVAATIATTLNCQLQQVYGMAEGLICYTPPNAPDHIAHHTQGKPISPHDELKIIDPHGNPQPPGHTGELLTRGPYTPPGYHGAPQQNATSYTPDGWYRTGDLVHLTTDGNIVVTGRVGVHAGR
ncbi:AMP-binding protein [Dactylosporangium sp. CA-152071]|uniref:AMP-binding protein n=1 Tax=Dactylosporangium sp. CA-152071 TaxID=3239933 RepID=UPI003D9448B5